MIFRSILIALSIIPLELIREWIISFKAHAVQAVHIPRHFQEGSAGCVLSQLDDSERGLNAMIRRKRNASKIYEYFSLPVTQHGNMCVPGKTPPFCKPATDLIDLSTFLIAGDGLVNIPGRPVHAAACEVPGLQALLYRQICQKRNRLRRKMLFGKAVLQHEISMFRRKCFRIPVEQLIEPRIGKSFLGVTLYPNQGIQLLHRLKAFLRSGAFGNEITQKDKIFNTQRLKSLDNRIECHDIPVHISNNPDACGGGLYRQNLRTAQIRLHAIHF